MNIRRQPSTATPRSSFNEKNKGHVPAMLGIALTISVTAGACNRVTDSIELSTNAQQNLEAYLYGNVDDCLEISYQKPDGTYKATLYNTSTDGILYTGSAFSLNFMDPPFSTSTISLPLYSTGECIYGIDDNGDTTVIISPFFSNRHSFNASFNNIDTETYSILIRIPFYEGDATATYVAHNPQKTEFATYLNPVTISPEISSEITIQIQKLEKHYNPAELQQRVNNNRLVIEPSEEEIAIYKEAINLARIQMYIHNKDLDINERKDWPDLENILTQLSINFARLGKALNLKPEDFSKRIKSYIDNDYWILISPDLRNGYLGTSHTDGIIKLWLEPNDPKFIGVLTHEIIHQILNAYTPNNVLDEGATELLTIIATNKLKSYFGRTLLTSALGIDFYSQYVIDPNQFAKVINKPTSNRCTQELKVEPLLEMHIQSFAQRWGIEYNEENKVALNEIFYTKRCKIPGENLDLNQETVHIMRLKQILESVGVNWYDFLTTIAPPSAPSIVAEWWNITDNRLLIRY